MENDPHYVDVVLKRFEAAYKIAATLESTGETFEAVARRRAKEPEAYSWTTPTAA
ncbi:MAG: hypothetical protein NTV56_00735 [Alphaproteobacteria bacterium]|nr:hypothetical protein [Alphaproteobacteria bacterium]